MNKKLFDIIEDQPNYWRIRANKFFFLERKHLDKMIENYEKIHGLYPDNHFKTEKEAKIFLTNYVEPYIIMLKLSGEL